MTQEKRTLLAALLSFVVLMGWYLFFGNETTVPNQPPPVAAPTETAPAIPQPLSDFKKLEESGSPERPEARVLRETPLTRQEWTNRGGSLTKYIVKGYEINLLPFEGERSLDLLCSHCNAELPTDGQYALVSEGDHSVTFEAERNGLLVRKHFEWQPNQYLLDLRVTIQNRSKQEWKGRPGIGWKARQFPEGPKQALSFLRGPQDQRAFSYNLGGKVTHDGETEAAQELRGNITWAGIEDRYFLISLISRKISSDQILKLEKNADWLQLALYPEETTVPPQGNYEETYSFYLGPKEREALQVAGVGLEKAVDYGWFGLFAVPILKLLQIFYAAVKNWGIAIILLTIFAKILMNPLTIKSMKQMKEMQKLQPKLAELKEKYKDDKQRLNMETMQLFRNHKVNPMGGCLPMLLQMPIYIALYKVLYNAIELYRAPFFGFYKDLSAPDPYFILPILLGVFMVAQQKMTPTASVDPAQKQMMMIMPVMFTAFMLFLPLGLVLYIFVNTVMSVLQQWMYQKDIRWRDLIKGKWR